MGDPKLDTRYDKTTVLPIENGTMSKYPGTFELRIGDNGRAGYNYNKDMDKNVVTDRDYIPPPEPSQNEGVGLASNAHDQAEGGRASKNYDEGGSSSGDAGMGGSEVSVSKVIPKKVLSKAELDAYYKSMIAQMNNQMSANMQAPVAVQPTLDRDAARQEQEQPPGWLHDYMMNTYGVR